MTKNTKSKLACPKCNNDGTDGRHEIQWYEMIPSHRYIHGVVNGVLYVDEDTYADYAEASEGEGLYCQKCAHTWKIPTKLKTDFVNDGDYLAIAKEAGIEVEER